MQSGTPISFYVAADVRDVSSYVDEESDIIKIVIKKGNSKNFTLVQR